MTKLLLEIHIKDETKLDQLTRIHRGYVKQEYLLNSLKRICKGVKKTAFNTSLFDRLMRNGKVWTGQYLIKLYDEAKFPYTIADYEEYRQSQLPTFEECILSMKEIYCPDLKAAKDDFIDCSKHVLSGNPVDYLGSRLVELQKVETENLMWRKLVGEGWSIIDAMIVDGATSKELHNSVCEYLNKVGDDIIAQASYGPSASTDPMYNVLENLKHEVIAKWCRRHASEIRSLVEGEDYQ